MYCAGVQPLPAPRALRGGGGAARGAPPRAARGEPRRGEAGQTGSEVEGSLGLRWSVRALVVINPGNPTGQSLPQEMIETILAFAAERGLVVLADEVYQENVYGDAPSFTSFKRAYAALEAKGSAGDAAAAATAAKVQLVSFHSTSKGFFGECGLRGGYFELSGISTDLKAQLANNRSHYNHSTLQISRRRPQTIAAT